ncbi:hypothetical protein [Phytomonospora endophytica]|uniref:Opacity protein-like surface antigen n=1 Tax=Phytomonospora endophytica TaxID=714109 RepID=A0A841FRV5_9ACTN|nr:hypothetical protein [Phytomonospora endophytica]MBB6036037.1 opacity protein-like surface antigen [Phytomonospora endophytica]GIG66942.1 hypothetical protein Pen01_32370 [Phytomonospora endophytica]
MRTKTVVRASIAATAAAVAAIGAAAPAQAADANAYSIDGDGYLLGVMVHHDDGDKFYVGDSRADGHGVRGYLFDSNGNVLKTIYNGNGTAGPSATFSYDVLAGRDYTMKICTVDGSNDWSPTNCGYRAITE